MPRSVGLDLHRGLGPKLRPPTPVLRIQGRHRRRVQRGDGCRGGLDRVGPVSIAVGDQSGEELELLSRCELDGEAEAVATTAAVLPYLLAW